MELEKGIAFVTSDISVFSAEIEYFEKENFSFSNVYSTVDDAMSLIYKTQDVIIVDMPLLRDVNTDFNELVDKYCEDRDYSIDFASIDMPLFLMKEFRRDDSMNHNSLIYQRFSGIIWPVDFALYNELHIKSLESIIGPKEMIKKIRKDLK